MNNIAIFSIYSFPYGGAANNRIIAYSKGLIANGFNVDVFIIFSTDTPNHKHRMPDSGTFEGIDYFYPSGRYKSKYKIIRGVSRILKFRKTLGYLNVIKNYSILKKTYNTIIISTDQILSLFIFFALSKLISAKSIFIFDEYPIPIRHKLKNRIPLWKEYLYKKCLKYADGFVSISENLKNYYNSFAIKPTFVMPVITDVSRFLKIELKKSSKKNSYLCYMGNMELSKDDVDNLIKAFSLIACDFKNLELHLYGGPQKSTKELLISLIEELNLVGRVLLKGRIPSTEVPTILCNAAILVSSQPKTLRASGGFPTKLGEYLATGVPSILTDVGENSKYVQNGVHVYLVPPHDPKKYAEMIKYILTNYEEAKKVALEGKNFLFQNYSHIKQGKRLAHFIHNLNSSCNTDD